MRDPLDIAIYTLGLPISGEDPAELSLGGSETAVVCMARGLARTGCRVTVYCNTTDPGRRHDVHYVAASEIGARLGERPCDLLLSCRHHGVLETELDAQMVGLWHHDMPSADLLETYPRALSKMSFSIFLSRFQAHAYQKVVPGLGASAWVTTNGVDFDALEAAVAGGEPAGTDPVFVYASRPERGLLFLLRRIWPRIVARHPGARLLVSTYDLHEAGLGAELRRHYGDCAELARRSRGVEALGSLPRCKLWRQLAAATAVLYPGDFPETSCMVALEAQAAGVPIVATDDFALAETIGFAETRIPRGEDLEKYADGFVETACRLAEDEGFRRAARAAGHAHVRRETHSWDALARRWAAFFHDAFSERFAGSRRGVLRALLHASENRAARRLVSSAANPEATFDAADLAAVVDLDRSADARPSEPPPSAAERVFRIAPRPRVSALLLVKNEEANVRRAIEGFEALADEIVVGDTGSEDFTVRILESMGFTGNEGSRRLVRIEFEDFAQARNELAVHATGDVIYWQDADELLSAADELRRWIDENVFFDAFRLEQRHRAFDAEIASDLPTRCFRPLTADGPLRWVGAVHESVEHAPNRPPERTLLLPGLGVGHFGYSHSALRLRKSVGRNRGLLLRDRRQNPDRWMGYVLGLRECLTVAKIERLEHGALSRTGYRHLNLGWEIWERHVRSLPDGLREIGFLFSREILAILGECKLPLERTGEVPFEADFALAVQRGRLGVPAERIEHERVYFATVAELREEFNHRLDLLERQGGQVFEHPPELLPESPDPEPVALPADLFGFDDGEG